MKPYYHIPNICNELLFPASVIDGTALAISGYCREKNNPVFTLFVLENFYDLLGLAVQLPSETEFKARLDSLFTEFTSLAKDKGLGTN